VVVIPLTSIGKQTKGDTFDVLVSKDTDNNLFVSSHARLRQLRAVSTKRLWKKLWEVTSDVVKKVINDKITKMLWIEA
jgi:mRNA-degrading endonuclease toxin of MazEF toxin-antitoxin module